MMSLTFGLFNQVSGLGPLGPLVIQVSRADALKVDWFFQTVITRHGDRRS